MADTQLLVELDGNRLSDGDLRSLAEVQLEEATDVSDAATLVASLAADGSGEWTSVLDPLLSPATPVVVQITRGQASYRFEGRSTQASWRIDPEAGSRLSVVAVDRSIELDLEEKIVAWPGSADSDIAETILSSYGFATDVEATPDRPDPDVHVVLQRASDLAFVRALAAKWGYAVYITADGTRVTGHFRPIDPNAEPQAELALGFGSDAQHATVAARLTDGQRVKAWRVPPLSDSAQTADETGEDQAQGSTSLAGRATVLMTPSEVSGEIDPSSAAAAIAHRSAFVVQLSVEIDADRTGLLLRARRPVLVKGLGSALSGLYLVQRVRHTVTLERHRQQLTLTRNALGLRGNEQFGSTSSIGGLA